MSRWIWVCAFGILSGSALAAAEQGAGRVSLVIGQASRISPAGDRVEVKVGLVIWPGDRIETAKGGHAHVRFHDGGLVSVRPSSRLIVEDYQYNPVNIQASTVRFRLEQGVVRSISGAAAEGARERFRLNTPLVAIGVRGTDFVVQTSEYQSVANVHQGAIVLAPLGGECAVDALGPCSTSAAHQLSADAGALLVEWREGMTQPEVREMLARDDADWKNKQKTPEAVPVEVVASDNGRHGDVVASASLNQDRLTTALAPVDTNPDSLVWGRWGSSSGGADFSLPREEARQQGEAVAYGWPYVLYRSQAHQTPWPGHAGKVSFALRSASAQYQVAGLSQDVAVTSGSLVVDFAASRYKTELQINDLPYFLSNLAQSGVIAPDGRFETSGGGQKVAGAVTFDTRSAAYWFQKASSLGVVSGITLWGR